MSYRLAFLLSGQVLVNDLFWKKFRTASREIASQHFGGKRDSSLIARVNNSLTWSRQ